MNSVIPAGLPLVDSWFLLLGIDDEGRNGQLASVRIVSHTWSRFKINKRREKRSLDHLCIFLCVYFIVGGAILVSLQHVGPDSRELYVCHMRVLRETVFSQPPVQRSEACDLL